MSLLVSFLLWLDALPARYWACVYVAAGLVTFSAFTAYGWPATVKRWNRAPLFAALLGMALLSFRWPFIFDNQQGNNPDESQMIAGAIVLEANPVFWKTVDGTTHGPLVQLPLAALGALGMRLDYTNARIVSTVLVWAMLVCTWLALRVPFGDGLARVLVLPAAGFEITTTFWDFNQYSSEHVPIALIAGATWLLVAETQRDRDRRPWRLGLAGLLLGAVPFAKLQGVPIGLWLGMSGLALLLADPRAPWPARLRSAAWLLGGAFVVPVGMLAIILVSGVFSDFWISYIQTNLIYAGTYPLKFAGAVRLFFQLIHAAGNFREYFQPMGWMLLGGIALRLVLRDTTHLRFTILVLGLLLVSVYAVVAPNRVFMHYVQFLIGPLTLATGAAIGPILCRFQEQAAARPSRRLRLIGATLVAATACVGCSLLVGNFSFREPELVGRFSRTRGQITRSPVARMLMSLTRPTDTVAMWGWEPHAFVEANRRHATREAHTALELYPSSLRDYFRTRYLADVLRANPVVFADVVGPGSFFFEDRAQYGHETFPELADYIAAHYRLVGEINATRIYLRNDRSPASTAMNSLP